MDQDHPARLAESLPRLVLRKKVPGSLSVDYDQMAPTYDRRFAHNERSGTAQGLLAWARERGEGLASKPRILEVGCGTGRWLGEVQAAASHVHGLDLSAGMLRQACHRQQTLPLRLVRGRAERLPYRDASFDLVYCVNAIHHFGQPRAFVGEARRLLWPGGQLAVIGMDPHGRRESWYVYHYFDGVFETDLGRFPSWETVVHWMGEEGLQGIECRVIERIWAPKTGRSVLEDPFLCKHSCSQLALLSQEAYDAGLRQIEAALQQAEAAGRILTFAVDMPLAMISGQVGEVAR